MRRVLIAAALLVGSLFVSGYTPAQIERFCQTHDTLACRRYYHQPSALNGDWELVFNDDFHGTTLDTNKWRPNWLGPTDTAITKPVNSREVSCYDPAQVRVRNGKLELTAEHRTCGQWDYASGLVESRHDFMFGPPAFIEARVLFPGDGRIANFPAFWTNGLDWPTTGENDIVEGLSGGRACWHYHSPEGAPGGCPTFDGTGVHTYAAYWEPGRIRWYYDGKQVGELTENVKTAPHYLIANNGLAPSINPIQVPSTVKVDYVRVWRPA